MLLTSTPATWTSAFSKVPFAVRQQLLLLVLVLMWWWWWCRWASWLLINYYNKWEFTLLCIDFVKKWTFQIGELIWTSWSWHSFEDYLSRILHDSDCRWLVNACYALLPFLIFNFLPWPTSNSCQHIIYICLPLRRHVSVIIKHTHVNEWFIQLCFCKCTSFSDIWPSFIPWVFEDLCLQVCNLVIMVLFQGMLNCLICSFDQKHWWVVLSVFSFKFMKVWNSCARLFRHDWRRWCEISLPQIDWRYVVPWI